jgi:hypothetical protein
MKIDEHDMQNLSVGKLYSYIIQNVKGNVNDGSFSHLFPSNKEMIGWREAGDDEI